MACFPGRKVPEAEQKHCRRMGHWLSRPEHVHAFTCY